MQANVRRCCKSCPFRSDGEDAFAPDVLDATIGWNLREGYAHRCHQTNNAKHSKVCAGFLRFVRREGIENRLVTLGDRMGVFGPVDETAPLIEGGWSAVLAEHHRRINGEEVP